jgi:hypothetical protein
MGLFINCPNLWQIVPKTSRQRMSKKRDLYVQGGLLMNYLLESKRTIMVARSQKENRTELYQILAEEKVGKGHKKNE